MSLTYTDEYAEGPEMYEDDLETWERNQLAEDLALEPEMEMPWDDDYEETDE